MRERSENFGSDAERIHGLIRSALYACPRRAGPHLLGVNALYSTQTVKAEVRQQRHAPPSQQSYELINLAALDPLLAVRPHVYLFPVILVQVRL
jgi:hypothetical protein